jgi:hypothetical protein
MLEQSFTCVDCGIASPPTEEGETITKQHGWRVMRRNVAGVFTIEARCPLCVANQRITTAAAAPAPARKR